MEMHAQYAAAGFERREIMSMLSYERETGSIHEASTFNSGNELALDVPAPLPSPKKEVIQALAKDMADAMASGPFTGAENLLDSTIKE